ncbi:ATP-binding protein [Winogradskya humida]|uniref:ATP-binding protein n=1 Tax=Winogradskya humida TaxID=113566 RepID=UPI001940A27A|nr:ATP-binding protein [Actinoplanes humidus]
MSATPGGRSLIAVGPNGASYPELRDRVYAGVTNTGLTWPDRHVHITLTPQGPGPGKGSVQPSADLAVTAAVLAATGHLPSTALNETMFLGEVGLDGAVRPVPDTLALVAAAADRGYPTVMVPAANARHAMLVPGVHVVAVQSLSELVTWATTGRQPALPALHADGASAGEGAAEAVPTFLPGWLSPARFALEVATAGRHHLNLTVTPEVPVPLIGECLRSLLPDLDDRQAVEVSALHAAAGRQVDALIRRPPLQAPGPATSVTTMIGGRRPGVASLAHRGVLLLHNAPDFAPEVLHALRQPLDQQIVQVARARGIMTFPADVQLVATSRPCPCSTAHSRTGGCTAPARRRYSNQMHSIADRLAITVRIDASASGDASVGESSATIAARVVAARAAASERWAQQGHSTNAEVPIDVLRQPALRLPVPATSNLRRLVDVGQVSIRAYHAVLRLAWTVSDLRGAGQPDKEAVDTAVELYLPRGDNH